MSTDSQQIVSKAWNFAHVLRDDGLSYMAYTEQITFLLFLKMADEITKPPYNRKAIVPVKFGWQSLLKLEGDELETHYRHCLEELGKQAGMLGEIFKKARPDIQNPATLRRLVVDLIEPVKWSSMDADVKGDIYEGLLAKSAEESPKGAGQYFTPRQLIKAIIDCVQPGPDDTVCDPACGTGGFLLGAYSYVLQHSGKTLDKDQKRHLRTKFVKGGDIVPNTARLCIMNLYLHGIDADPCPIKSGVDSLAGDPGERFSVVITNPPFGKKSSIAVVNEEGDLEKEDNVYEVYDLRTNMHFTLKTSTLKREDLDEFVECYRPGKRHLRKPTWDAEKNPEGRWRSFDYEELVKRDKVNLDILWLKDKSLEDSNDLPAPDVLAQEIADDLQTALEQFQAIAEKVKG
jgi:type I restriction enzyme M protein